MNFYGDLHDSRRSAYSPRLYPALFIHQRLCLKGSFNVEHLETGHLRLHRSVGVA